jgi:protocatechuate 3,4-dioxygenase beta subunit
LPPGDYYVTATLRSGGAMMIDMLAVNLGGTNANQTTGYASTYYPGTPNPAEAQRVTVAVGQELSSVDIQLQPVRLAKITGVAMASDGRPMSGAMVMLMPAMKDAMIFAPGGTARTNADGQFTLTGVTPGEYSLQVQSSGATFMTSAGGNTMVFAMSERINGVEQNQPNSQQREFAVASVNVAGEDISGLVVTGMRGAKASGTIRFEGGAKPEGITGIRINAPAVDADSSPMPAFGANAVKDSGAFEVEGLVGARLFRPLNLPKGWFLKSVTVNGEDVTDRGVEFKPGEDVSGIDIELTNRSSSITGSVTDERGTALKDYTVVLFPEDQAKWTLPNNRWMSSARPDQEGRFRFNALPAGAYYAIAVEYVAQGEWSDPEWLARAAKKATKVTLDEGGSKNLDLKLAGS